ncbi:unnamed protein product [Cylicocyclus nassatus]|uniref:Uncharacterized protein n=1 Tax=Cylicocyclus nassatus TaxID=53992 RepID=A0AA36GNL3_CYLNA|nr:unnamed protein product [Cylicocyclus nassatus]
MGHASELAQALRLLARLSYIFGDSDEAVPQEHRAALMSQRCTGLVMHLPLNILTLPTLLSNLYISAAVRLLYRTRYMLLIPHGENHPLMAQSDEAVIHWSDSRIMILTFSKVSRGRDYDKYSFESLDKALYEDIHGLLLFDSLWRRI